MFGLYMLAIYLGIAIIAAGFVALLVVVALAVGLGFQGLVGTCAYQPRILAGELRNGNLVHAVETVTMIGVLAVGPDNVAARSLIDEQGFEHVLSVAFDEFPDDVSH